MSSTTYQLREAKKLSKVRLAKTRLGKARLSKAKSSKVRSTKARLARARLFIESEVIDRETVESENIESETNEIEIAGDQVVTQDHNSVQQIPVADSNGAENQEEPAEGLSQATEHRAVASVPLDNSLQTSAALTERQDSNRAGGTFDLSPRDPITSRRTLEFVEDLLTPLQTVPMDSDHETTAEVRTVLQ